MSGGARVPPGAGEGMAIARTVTNELDSAKFDPLLLRAVAKNANSALEGFAGRVDNMVWFSVKDSNLNLVSFSCV